MCPSSASTSRPTSSIVKQVLLCGSHKAIDKDDGQGTPYYTWKRDLQKETWTVASGTTIDNRIFMYPDDLLADFCM